MQDVWQSRTEPGKEESLLDGLQLLTILFFFYWLLGNAEMDVRINGKVSW